MTAAGQHARQWINVYGQSSLQFIKVFDRVRRYHTDSITSEFREYLSQQSNLNPERNSKIDLIPQLLKKFKLVNIKVLLDTNIGTGLLTNAVAKAHPEIKKIIGLDTNVSHLKQAAQTLQPLVKQGVDIHLYYGHCGHVSEVFQQLPEQLKTAIKNNNGVDAVLIHPTSIRKSAQLELAQEYSSIEQRATQPVQVDDLDTCSGHISDRIAKEPHRDTEQASNTLSQTSTVQASNTLSLTSSEGVMVQQSSQVVNSPMPGSDIVVHSQQEVSPLLSPAARKVLNQVSYHELVRLINANMPQAHAATIAQGLVRARKTVEFTTVADVVSSIQQGMLVVSGTHEVVQLAQQLLVTIHAQVKDRKSMYKLAIQGATDLMRPGGRLVILVASSDDIQTVEKEVKRLSHFSPRFLSKYFDSRGLGRPKTGPLYLVNMGPVTSFFGNLLTDKSVQTQTVMWVAQKN